MGIESLKTWLKHHWGSTLWIIILFVFLGNVFYLLAPQPQTYITLESAHNTVVDQTNSTSDDIADSLDKNAIEASSSTPKKSTRHYAKKQLKKVHINSASVTDLQHLPGVGLKMAERIVIYRKQVGQFKSCDELNNVSGIGPKKLAKMKAYCLL